MEKGRESYLQDLFLPEDSRDPSERLLYFPDGTIRGTLHDAETGAPFNEMEPRWWITLNHEVQKRVVARIDGGQRGSVFEIPGLNGGVYTLEVTALGYFDFRSDAFTLQGGENLDLGPLRLSPCGVLDLEVLDGDQQPVSSFRVLCEGLEVPVHTRRYLAPGKFRYYQLPLKPVWLTVEAPGRISQDLLIDLEAGITRTEQVVLPSR
jgi:hypothetical protein